MAVTSFWPSKARSLKRYPRHSNAQVGSRGCCRHQRWRLAAGSMRLRRPAVASARAVPCAGARVAVVARLGRTRAQQRDGGGRKLIYRWRATQLAAAMAPVGGRVALRPTALMIGLLSELDAELADVPRTLSRAASLAAQRLTKPAMPSRSRRNNEAQVAAGRRQTWRSRRPSSRNGLLARSGQSDTAGCSHRFRRSSVTSSVRRAHPGYRAALSIAPDRISSRRRRRRRPSHWRIICACISLKWPHRQAVPGSSRMHLQRLAVTLWRARRVRQASRQRAQGVSGGPPLAHS